METTTFATFSRDLLRTVGPKAGDGAERDRGIDVPTVVHADASGL
jgi:hypothetical protein